ncbi:MAG: hypothetical protein WBC97_04175 [Gemmatimonadales bacterium]
MMAIRRSVPWLVLMALVAAGCDLPTTAPKWNTTWILPIKDDTIRVAQFLPASVDTAGGAFITTVKRDSIRQSLGQMCAACGVINGTVDSVPAFTIQFGHTDSLASQVFSITPTGTSFSVRFDNGLGFDPLQPGVGQVGSIVTVIKDSTGGVIGQDSVDGGSLSFPTGTSLTRSISLGTNPIGGRVDVVTTVNVPHGDPASIDTSNAFQATTLTDTLALAGVTVQVTNQNIQSDSVSIDWSGIDNDIQSKMQGAALQLTLHNPFTVSGTDSIFFRQGAVDVIPAKVMTFSAGVTTQSIPVSQADIQALASAGKSTIQVVGSVTGTGPGQSVTITPDQVAIVQAHVLVTILVGGN